MMKEDINKFLNSEAFWICLVVAILLLIALICLIVGMVRYHLKNKKAKQEKTSNEEWFLALGGKENIIFASGVGSRLKVQLKVKENIDKNLLIKLGVTSIIKMSDALILVVENKAEKISELLN